MNKVFCIGMFKTGTTSMGQAFALLGYRTLNGPVWSFNTDTNCEKKHKWDYNMIKPLIESYGAFQDFPFMYMYEELDKWYPNSKFIYTERDVEKLIQSEINAFKNDGNPNVPHADIFRNRYEKHREKVLKYIEGKDNFLIMNLSKGDGWEKLCSFLNRTIPSYNFPHANKGVYNK